MLSLVNPLLQIDVYKNAHRTMYPAGTTSVYSNWVFRKSRLPVNHATFYGLRNYLANLQMKWGLFFHDEKIAGEMIQDYARIMFDTLGYHVNTGHFQSLFMTKRLPLTIRSVREGTRLPIGVPAFTVESTVPHAFWLPQFIESEFSNGFWKAPTAATLSVERRRKDNIAVEQSGGPVEMLPYLNHDFSYRGTSGQEDAIMVGLGHLVGSNGSDTVPAIARVQELYPGSRAGRSIAASEHSVMSIGTRELEFETFERILSLYPDKAVSIVSDTWNLWKVLSDYLPRLGEKLTNRTAPLVIRPDSGDPVAILMGDPSSEVGIVRQGVIPFLLDKFSDRSRLTDYGYRLLPPFLGTIYGDAMTPERCDQLNAVMLDHFICPTNAVRGIGSFTYEYLTRDSLGQALKVTQGTVRGAGREVSKDPITSDGEKKSFKGRVGLVFDAEGNIIGAKDQLQPGENDGYPWVPLNDGRFEENDGSFDDVRARTGVWK